MFPGGGKGTVRKRRRKLTYRKGNQDIEGTVGATGEIQRPNGSQANALKDIVKILVNDLNKIEDRGNVKRERKKVEEKDEEVRVLSN